VVHPEWLSEGVDNTEPQPLHRPPWPWEQPRYRQNVQIPITYNVDQGAAEGTPSTNEVFGDVNMFGECEMRTVTPCPRAMPIGYLFTQPLMEDTKPFAKHTAFGAPAVDTSYYKNT